MKKQKEPTYVSRVLEYLRKSDDYIIRDRIIRDTGVNANQTSAALHMLRHYNCVSTVESQGELYWFALPEEMDQRYRVVQGRVKEVIPRKRKKKVRKIENSDDVGT